MNLFIIHPGGKDPFAMLDFLVNSDEIEMRLRVGSEDVQASDNEFPVQFDKKLYLTESRAISSRYYFTKKTL